MLDSLWQIAFYGFWAYILYWLARGFTVMSVHAAGLFA